MFLVPGDGEAHTLRPEADELPGPHAALPAASAAATASCRCATPSQSTLHRNELAGALHGLLRVRHVTQDDAHIFCTMDQIEDEIFALPRLRRPALRHLRRACRSPSSRSGPTTSWAPTRTGTSPRRRSRGRSSGAASSTCTSPGEGAFYGPKIDLHMTDAIGRSWQMGTIQLDFQMPARFGLSYVGADNADHMPVVIHRALLGLARAVHRHPDRARRRSVPAVDRAGAGHRAARRRPPPRVCGAGRGGAGRGGPARRARPAQRVGRQEDRRGRAPAHAVHPGGGRPGGRGRDGLGQAPRQGRPGRPAARRAPRRAVARRPAAARRYSEVRPT